MVIEKTIPLLVIFLIAYLLKSLGILKKEDGDPVGKLVIYLVAPAVIAASLARVPITTQLMVLPLIAVIAVSSLLVIGYLSSLALGLSGKTKGAFIIAFPTLEGGTIGYAVMLAAFGALGLSRIVLFDFGNALFEFTVIYFIAVLLGRSHSKESPGALILSSLPKVFGTPLVWAVFAGLALNFAKVESQYLFGILNMAGSGLIVLVMVMLGLEFEPKITSFKLPAITILLQIPASLLVAALLTWVFGLQGIERIATFVAICLPTSIMGLVFAKENGLDSEFVANLLAIGLPLSLIFLPVLLYFIR